MTRTLTRPGEQRIALVWDQFAPYHIDRCEAVADRLAGRASCTFVEVASASHRYAWPSAGPVAGGRKVTLFPERRVEEVGLFEKVRALIDCLADQDLVILGLSSAEPASFLVAYALKARGTPTVFCSDSKADDYPRSRLGEMAKALLLRGYVGGLVAGTRSFAYYRSLGIAEERLWLGYDTISTKRVRALGAQAVDTPWEDRPFLFLGRFVRKKGLDLLLEAFAAYRQNTARPRELVMAGDGPLRADLEAQARALGIVDHIRWTGFVDAAQGAREISGALALVLPSREEQWGLVVNEAVALNTPPIVSDQVGARDLLVCNGVNGLVFETGAIGGLVQAFVQMGSSKDEWERMARACEDFVWYADYDRFADAVEDIAFPGKPALRAVQERMRNGNA